MSEYFQRKYRPIADALLMAHGLTVPSDTRDMLADAMTHNRELPRRESESRGSHSALPALRTARTHASKLIEYADHPPARKASVPLHCAKLASAIRSNESLVGINLVLADPPIDPNALLDALDSGSFDVDVLRELVRVADAVEAESGGVGRPWAAHTTIIRSGCIAWERAGRVVTCSWNRKSGANNGKLTGPLPAFLRDLIACCDGTHEFTKAKPRRVPAGYRDPGRIPKGNMLRERVPDYVLRDGIYAWRKWSKAHPAKS